MKGKRGRSDRRPIPRSVNILDVDEPKNIWRPQLVMGGPSLLMGGSTHSQG